MENNDRNINVSVIITKKKGITNFVHKTLVSDKIPVEWRGSKG